MIVIPEIVDYEVRRSLILAGSQDGVGRLDDLYASCVRLLPINRSAMKRAAELWADARRRGAQTAPDQALDADVIFSAQAIEFCSDLDEWQIITENVGHITRYVGDRARSRRLVVGNWLKSERGILDPDQG
jgi:predicted nucleic acid-binding protein